MTTWTHQPKLPSEFIDECGWYLVPGLFVHIAMLIFSVIVIGVAGAYGLRVPKFSTVLIFHGFLLPCAMLANGIWSCSVWGHLYFSTDYLSDFSPFYPIPRHFVTANFGSQVAGLNDVTLLQLNGVWLMHSVAVWLMALFLTKFSKQVQKTRSLEP